MRVLAASTLAFLLAGTAASQTPTADAPAAAVKPGATLETSGFQYERRLPDGPSELVTLPLDPAVLAHSRTFESSTIGTRRFRTSSSSAPNH
jgi:hypothetical protein